jgi:hypothetical protein
MALTFWRGGLAAATAVGLTVLLGALSRVPYEAGGHDNAALRLTWRARGARVEECRTLTPEELERIPAHMRQPQVCEGRILPHRLVLRVDGRVAVDETVRAAGAKHDRPLYVFYDIPLPAGEHRIAVSFNREEPESTTVDTTGAVPGRLELETVLMLQRKEVALITYDREQRRLIHKGYGR